MEFSPYLNINGQCAAAFRIYDALMGSDAPPDRYERPHGTYVSFGAAHADADRIFQALAEGGRIEMPFQKTFFSPGFGMVIAGSASRG